MHKIYNIYSGKKSEHRKGMQSNKKKKPFMKKVIIRQR